MINVIEVSTNGFYWPYSAPDLDKLAPTEG